MRAAWLLLALAAFGQPAGAHPLGCAEGAEAWLRSELYFGMSGPDGQIADVDFYVFLDEEVTPRFPDGLTLHRAHGRWQRPDGALIQEHARVVVLFHPDSAEASAHLSTIRSAYKQAFDQLSVLLVQRPECVSF